MSSDSDSSVELVITPPEPFGVVLADRTNCRTTLGVLTQLLVQAEQRVVISAPFLQQGYGLSGGPMAVALKGALVRGCHVDIVSTRRSLTTLNAASFRDGAVGKLRLFCSTVNINDDTRLGSHAKFCVSDGWRAYVGSANLTHPGLSGHLEIGLFVMGKVAKQIEELWLHSIQVGLFQCVD